MRIITVMNYADPNGVAMCKIWLYLAKRFNPSAAITIFHDDKFELIRPFALRFPDVSLVRLKTAGIPPWTQSKGLGVPSQMLLLALWRHIDETGHPKKHLYVEADAWILGPLDRWWKAADDKPYISTEERLLPDGLPLINTGTHSCSGRVGFVSYRKLLDQLARDGGAIPIPVGEQGLVNAYFRRIGYDCRHPDIGFEYNCWALNCRVDRADDGGIVVTSGKRPAAGRDRGLNWGWWDRETRAVILHAFFIKFWEIPECRPLWEYCAGKVAEIESRPHRQSR